MSDFLFSFDPRPKFQLTNCIQSIYRNDAPVVHEYNGEWGTLALSRNLYEGLQPLETTRHIFVVIGGPVLCFRNNCFLTGNDEVEGTRAIYDRWLNGNMLWDEDLSGPYVILAVDKEAQTIMCVTDLMMFIPVYSYKRGRTIMLGTHLDALAQAAGQYSFDMVALSDFIINHAVTYPYTSYKEVRQCHPAAVTTGSRNGFSQPLIYWLPREEQAYATIGEAANALKVGLQGYVNRIIQSMNEVAQFISAGEDSRAIAGLLSKKIKCDAFIFLDKMNREGKIAGQIAAIYGEDFKPRFRNSTHYLDILEEASDLIGSGQQYFHAHTLGFHKSCGFSRYPAVFGGYIADSLIKANYTRKIRGQHLTPYIPNYFISGETRTEPIRHSTFQPNVLEEIDYRRSAHMEKIKSFRQRTAHEWFVLWPVTMRVAIPNLHSNRRLFRTYEPFMCKEVVKISASVPINWKLNRRLFQKATQPFLRTSRHIFHADGRLPYYPWWVNSFIQPGVLIWIRSMKALGILRGNQGPWGDWQANMKDQKWRDSVHKYCLTSTGINRVFKTDDIKKNIDGPILNYIQKINLIQTLYLLNKSTAFSGKE